MANIETRLGRIVLASGARAGLPPLDAVRASGLLAALVALPLAAPGGMTLVGFFLFVLVGLQVLRDLHQAKFGLEQSAPPEGTGGALVGFALAVLVGGLLWGGFPALLASLPLALFGASVAAERLAIEDARSGSSGSRA